MMPACPDQKSHCNVIFVERAVNTEVRTLYVRGKTVRGAKRDSPSLEGPILGAERLDPQVGFLFCRLFVSNMRAVAKRI
jgi:hypothetical protein